MLKKIVTVLFIAVVATGFAQEAAVDSLAQEEVVSLKGQVVDFATKSPLRGSHLFNLNSVIGTISNDDGFFEINSKLNDTIYVSYVGFQSIKLKITNDLLKGNELVIELHEKPEQIDEVVVKSHKLIGVLEIDAKNVPKDKYARIHINGISQTYEIGARKARSYTSPVDALSNPIDFVYNRFGSKPKQLKKMKKLRDDDKLRALLENTDNRELMMEYLDLDSDDLADLLNECNYSNQFIRRASDLQLIEAVLLCYENYKAVRKGSTKRPN